MVSWTFGGSGMSSANRCFPSLLAAETFAKQNANHWDSWEIFQLTPTGLRGVYQAIVA